MLKKIKNMLGIPRVGTYLYYRPNEEAKTRFVEVTDFVDGRVYFNGDDGRGDCTLQGWQNWLRNEVAIIEEYGI